MPTTDTQQGLEHWGRKLQGENPCGEDLSQDSHFESLQDEIGKDTSIHDGQKTNWIVVYELADSILARSKDLWAYAYGSVAVYNTRPPAECATVVASLAGLIRERWATLHPSLKRPQRRLAPLKWLANKFKNLAERTAFIGVDPDALSALNDAFVKLQEALDTHLPDNDLGFDAILRVQMGATPTTLAPNTATDEQLGQKTFHAANTTAQAPRFDTTLDAVEKSSIIASAVLPQVIRAANENSRQLGDHLLAINSTHEPGFLLHRVAIWYSLLQLPPSDEKGLTQMLCPVVADMIDMYTAAVNDKRYAEVLPSLEKAASKAPFWVDGHHLVVRCLEGLSAVEAAYSVKHSLAQLVRRFPEIMTLKFKDGRSFASPKTVAWIESFAPSVFGESLFAGGLFPGGTNSDHEDEATLFQEALAMNADTGFEAGLEHLGKAHPGRNRAFIRHCIVRARYCIAVGHTPSAVMLLQTVFEKLKEWNLLDWEPEVTTAAVALLLSLKKKQQEQDTELSAVLHMFSLETAISSTKAHSS